MINPLLVLFQFRKIPMFLESVKQLTKQEKLWVKFYPQHQAYWMAREIFLPRKDLTHFLLLTDDVIVKQSDIDQLCKDAEENPDKEVISAWFNGNLTDHIGDTNFSFILPPNPPCNSTYEGYKFESMSYLDEIGNPPTRDIIEVMHQGTALTLLSRRVIEEVPFRHSLGCCIDSCLSLDLHAKGIKQYVDLRLRCLHLKINDDYQWRISEVGKNDPEIKFEPAIAV